MKALKWVLPILLMTGCVSVGKTVLVPGLAPVAESQVMIYLPGDSVPPHTRVAILDAESNDMANNNAQVLAKLRRAAGELGADAVVLVGRESESDVSQATRALVTGADLGGKVFTQAFAIKLR